MEIEVKCSFYVGGKLVMVVYDKAEMGYVVLVETRAWRIKGG